MSESIPVCFMLALSGGCMDAYSYLIRDEVFANAQTGNLLLFGINLAQQNWKTALSYFMPIACFALGLIISNYLRIKIKNWRFHWREIAIILEMLGLLTVCFIPQTMNMLANVIISFVCGIQVECFKSVEGNVISTTMCIGNLKSGTFNMGKFIQTHDKAFLKKSILYYATITFFILGAVIESFLLHSLSEFALLLSIFFLIIIFVLMLKNPSND